MRSLFVFSIASVLVSSSLCVDAVDSKAEGLCLLQRKAAKHARSVAHEASEESDFTDVSGGGPVGTVTAEQTALLAEQAMPSASSSSVDTNSEEMLEDTNVQGITDVEAYGGSMMDLVLGGWRHRDENHAKKGPTSSSAEVADSKPSDVSKPDSNSKQVVDAFGDPVKDMDVGLLSMTPAVFRVEPPLEDSPPVAVAYNGPSEEPADKVLAEAQKSLEVYSAVLGETQKISLLDETESHKQDRSQQQTSPSILTNNSHAHAAMEHKKAVDTKHAFPERKAKSSHESLTHIGKDEAVALSTKHQISSQQKHLQAKTHAKIH